MTHPPDAPSSDATEQIVLQIKSLEQTTTSITIARSASVLKLKHEIKIALNVDSDRQRLIFQGRVLKDDKNLADYANLDNGKVVHLVIRPSDAPHNPLNDDPNTPETTRQTPTGTFRLPLGSNGFPVMEGYAFVTLDPSMRQLGDTQSLLSSVLSGFSAASRNSANSNNNSESPSPNASGTNIHFTTRQAGIFPRTPFTFASTRTSTASSNTTSTNRSATGLPFPLSVELRLMRTLGSIRNVRNILNDRDSTNATDQSPFSPLTISTPEQMQEFRRRLRESGNHQYSQIGMVLSELADLMTETIPRIREVSSTLRQRTRSPTEAQQVSHMASIAQGMGLINHLLGSVLASTNSDFARRSTSTTTRPTTTLLPTVTINNTSNTSTSNNQSPIAGYPSYFYPNGNTETIRATSPNLTRPPNITPNPNKKNEPSPLSKSTPESGPSTSTKRKQEENKELEEEGGCSKKSKKDKEKEKDEKND